MRRFLPLWAFVATFVVLLGFTFGFYETNSTSVVIQASLIASSLAAVSVFIFEKIKTPLGKKTSVAAITLLWFIVGLVLSFLSSSCPATPGVRCTPKAAVASAFTLCLLPLTLAIMWWLTRFSVKLFSRLFGRLFWFLRRR